MSLTLITQRMHTIYMCTNPYYTTYTYYINVRGPLLHNVYILYKCTLTPTTQRIHTI